MLGRNKCHAMPYNNIIMYGDASCDIKIATSIDKNSRSDSNIRSINVLTAANICIF